jgi:type I restriction enzyme S subunit
MFNTCTIKDLLNSGEAELRTGPFGFLFHASEASCTGVPMIHIRNIGMGNIREEKLEFVPKEVAQRLPEQLLQPGDIVFGRKSAVDRHALVTPKHTNWMQGSDCIRLRLKSPSIHPKFLSYCFLTDRHRQWMINQCSHGEKMSSLNHAIIGRIPLSLPPVHVQQEIVDILSDYDELIENNLKQLNLLEEILRSIYHEWFIRSCSSDWAVQKLEEIADINKASLNKQNAPEIIHYVDISSVSTGKIDRIEFIPFSNASSRARRIARCGDIIWSTVRPSRRVYSIVEERELIVSTGFAVITPKTVSYTYLYCALSTDEFVEHLIRSATGSAYPAVSIDCFKNALIPIPPVALLEKFHAIAEDIFKQKNCIVKKNHNLAKSRDLLMHRLLATSKQ